MSDYAIPGQRTIVLSFTGDDLGLLTAFADAPRSYVDQFVPMLRRKLATKVESRIAHEAVPHYSVPGYDADDPKAHALDPDFNPDLARDIARGK